MKIIQWLKNKFCQHGSAILLATIKVDGGSYISSGIKVVNVPRDIEIYTCPDCGKEKVGHADYREVKK